MTARLIAVPLHDFAAGGSERIAIRLANAWTESGRRVVLFCGQAEGSLRPLVSPKVEIAQALPSIPRGRGSRQRLGAALATWAQKAAPDILFIPGNFHIPIALRLAGQPRRPVIVAKLSNLLSRPGRGRARQFLFDIVIRRSLRRFDCIVTMSSALIADAARLAPPGRIVEIAQPTLDDEAPPPCPADAASQEILAAGRLVEQKNFLLALQAFARLDRPQARLTILGEGPQRPALMAEIERLGLQGRCALPGLAPDIRPWLDRSRFFLLSSDYEGFPAVVVESLAAGRAVVATASSPVLDELITTRETGRIVPRGDVRALSEAMALLLDSPPADPALLAQNAARHRMAPVAARYLALFDEKTSP